MIVYQVVSTGSDGSVRRFLPLYADRKQAERVAEEHRDHDHTSINSGRWRVKIERLYVEVPR